MTMEKRGDINPAYTPNVVPPKVGQGAERTEVKPVTMDKLASASQPRPRSGPGVKPPGECNGK